MRNIVIHLLFLLLLTSHGLLAQTVRDYPPITINEADISVGEVLAAITTQTGLNFSYNSQIIAVEDRISFVIRRGSLEETLQLLGRKIKLAYRIVEDQIVLYLPPTSEKEEQRFTLSGFITDGTSGESLIGATVLKPGTNAGAISNAFGYYALPLPSGRHNLDYSYVGYQKQAVGLDIAAMAQKNLSLRPTSIALPDVIVAQRATNSLESADLGQMDLYPGELSAMPEFAGESGLVKGLQTLPGVKMHSDGSAFFYTRGGERDQNLIIVDDAPIYNPSHLFGFYSMIIPDFAKEIKVYKSDMPANLGDRLSSIISIRTKDGNLNKFELSGAINPLVNRFSLEIPVVKERSSIFTSWRRSNFEWLYKRAAPNADLGFGDFSFKWNYKINNKNRFYFTSILGVDNFTSETNGVRSGIRWGNFTSTLRWNHLFGPRLFSNTTLYTGSFDYRLFSNPNIWRSSLGTLSLKSDFTHYARANFTSKFGLEVQAYFINPGSVTLDSTVAILPAVEPDYSRKTVLYYQGQWDLNPKLQLKAGARLINWANLGPTEIYNYNSNYAPTDTTVVGEGVYNRYLHLDPRISLRYKLDSTSQVKLSFGSYHQYLQLISNSISPFTSLEVWLPANQYLQPQSAREVTLGYATTLSSQMSLSAAAYYKQFSHQIDYKDHATTLLNPLLEGELRFGTMQSYGLEVLLKKTSGRLNGSLSYNFSRATRQTEGLNAGRVYPAFQDRPHDFSLLLNYRLAKRTLFSTYYTAFSGTTFSSPTGFYTFNDQRVPIFDEKNNDRLPAYRRLDIAFKFQLNKNDEARYQHALVFSIYNVLAHKNIVAVNFNKIPVEGARPVVKSNLLSLEALQASQIDLIRFMPSLTYKFNLL